MRKTVGIVLVALMIIGVMGYGQVIAQEGDELEELVGLRIKIWQDIPTNWNTWGARENAWVEGRFWGIRGNWLILKAGSSKYIWCSISTIRRIEILDKSYKPEGE